MSVLRGKGRGAVSCGSLNDGIKGRGRVSELPIQTPGFAPSPFVPYTLSGFSGRSLCFARRSAQFAARPSFSCRWRKLSICMDLNSPGEDKPFKKFQLPTLTRRSALQILNGFLGAATLAVLLRMGNSFRFLSPRSVLGSLGLRDVPSRAARAAEVEGKVSKEMAQVAEFLKRAEGRGVPCPQFPKGADWVNSRPLALSKELKGKIVLLDFWTSCCINCQHILPKLAALEKKYGQDGSGGVVVVGVHSAKFPSERETANVAAAVEKFEVKHPVVNDVSMQMWSGIGITSWPSLVLVSPKGSLLALWSGENQERDIDACIGACLQIYKDDVDYRPLPTAPPRSALLSKSVESPLRYPSKLVPSADGKSLFVADTGNHRVLRLDMQTSNFIAAYGSGEAGFSDSSDPKTAKFRSPQGLELRGDKLWVCDTENHAVRLVDTATGAVSTIGGNGKQGFDYGAGKSGVRQTLSSPWDVELDAKNNILYVAMAGLHQIWSVEVGKDGLGTSPWIVFSGTGRELEKNSSNGKSAGWAQPSHLSLDPTGDDRVMWVADSESSSVRGIHVDPLDGAHPTKTLAGGDGLFAENLFAFGDKDGRGSSARLQHPLAVVACGDGSVLCADSYNHRIKQISRDGVVTTLVGDGKPGFQDGVGTSAKFWEPSGLAISSDGATVFVADSNNYAIRSIDLASRAVTTLKLADVPAPNQSVDLTRLIANRRRSVVLSESVPADQGELSLALVLPPKSHFTEGTVSRWQINQVATADGAMVAKIAGGDLKPDATTARANLTLPVEVLTGNQVGLEIEAIVFYCTDEDNVCRTESVVWNIGEDATSSKVSALEHAVRSRRAPQALRPEFAGT